MARLIRPESAKIDRRLTAILKKRGYDRLQIRALLAVTPAAASQLKTLAQFLEQVEYHGRRLAKMNVSPTQIAEVLNDCRALLEPVLAGRFGPASEQLHLATTLILDHSYHAVREIETQVLFGIYRAEASAVDLDDLLRRFVRVLTPAFRAQAGRIVTLPHPPAGKLAQPLYIERQTPDVVLIADPAMRAHASFWSYPLGGKLLLQFGFAVKYPWLPRELKLLEALAARCRAAELRAQLEASNRRLQALSLRAEEEERKRIGRELHDETGQSLLLLRLQLELMERTAPPELRAKLAECRAITESAITEVRRIAAALSPAVLERLGLRSALRHLAARFRKLSEATRQGSGTPDVALRISLGTEALPLDLQEVVYRVAQESLVNIAKHSSATQVKLFLRLADSSIRLSVSDNGAGLGDPAGAPKLGAFGLAGMRERAALLGGSLAVESAVGKGVTVRLQLPLDERR